MSSESKFAVQLCASNMPVPAFRVYSIVGYVRFLVLQPFQAHREQKSSVHIEHRTFSVRVNEVFDHRKSILMAEIRFLRPKNSLTLTEEVLCSTVQ